MINPAKTFDKGDKYQYAKFLNIETKAHTCMLNAPIWILLIFFNYLVGSVTKA